MKKNVAMVSMITAVLLVGTVSGMEAYAGTWQSDNAGWWWQEDNGSYPANEWRWIDGNGDGIAECYCFDGRGYLYCDTTTPDGYQVNKDGAWVSGAVVQTKFANMMNETGSAASSEYTEEELRRFTAGYKAAMRYPEGRIEKSELFPLNGEYPYDYIHWFVFINDEGGKPNLIDRGDFYEVTNCTIMFPYIVPDEVVSQFEDGFGFDVSLYDQNGKPDTWHSVVVYKDGDWWLTPDGNTDEEFNCRWVTADSSGKNVMTDDYGHYCLGTIYYGSLFFVKNGIIHDYWFSKSGTFEEYVSEELHVIHPDDSKYAWWGGKVDGDSVCFNGAVVFDPNTGMIVESVEYGFE